MADLSCDVVEVLSTIPWLLQFASDVKLYRLDNGKIPLHISEWKYNSWSQKDAQHASLDYEANFMFVLDIEKTAVDVGPMIEAFLDASENANGARSAEAGLMSVLSAGAYVSDLQPEQVLKTRPAYSDKSKNGMQIVSYYGFDQTLIPAILLYRAHFESYKAVLTTMCHAYEAHPKHRIDAIGMAPYCSDPIIYAPIWTAKVDDAHLTQVELVQMARPTIDRLLRISTREELVLPLEQWTSHADTSKTLWPLAEGAYMMQKIRESRK